MRRIGIAIVLGLFCQTLVLSSAVAAPDEWKISSKNFFNDTAGFASTNSVLPGEAVDLYVTCPSKTFTVSSFRMGYYDGKESQKYSTSEPIPCIKQSAQVVDPKTLMSESKWKVNTTLDTTDFLPGFYLLKITSDSRHQAFIPLVIREADLTSRVVISIPMLTSLAYNDWQGASAYHGKTGFSDRARVLSFDRPLKWGFGSGKYLHYLHSLLVAAEKSGVNPAYVTDVDVATIPGILSGVSAYVSGGHDEYWTSQERNSVIKARSEGTNLLFFGANVSYWRVRLTPSPLGANRRMEIYKSSSEDPQKQDKTIHFRDTNNPEGDLTGQNYNCYPAYGTFTVSNPSSFVFDGTGATSGSQYEGIIGLEVDRVAVESAITGPREIVASSSVTCGKERKSRTTFIYAVAPSKAGTISIGTMRWIARGLSSSKSVPERTRKFAAKVTANILIEAAKGPLGVLHPLQK